MKKQSLKDLAELVGRILAQRWYDRLQGAKTTADADANGRESPSFMTPADTRPPQQGKS